MKLSVVLATHNEEEHLENCLNSIKSIAYEIIIVDGNSKDKTRQIAKNFQAKVYIEPNRPMFHINKQIALEKAQGDWILQLDADEIVDSRLLKSIKKVVSEKKETNAGYYLKRKNYFLGYWLKKGGQYPDPVIRLIRKGKAHFPKKSVHEQISVSGKVATLNGHLIHHTAPTFFRYLKNSDRYTSLSASDLKNQRIQINFIGWIEYLVFKPIETFFNIYFRHLGFRDGFPGFVFALFSALHWPTAYMKYWEFNKETK